MQLHRLFNILTTEGRNDTKLVLKVSLTKPLTTQLIVSLSPSPAEERVKHSWTPELQHQDTKKMTQQQI